MKSDKTSIRPTQEGSSAKKKIRTKRAHLDDASRSPRPNRRTVLEPFVRKVANLEHEETGDGFDVFEFLKVNGRRGECMIPRDKALDDKNVTSALQQKNAALPSNPQEAAEMVRFAIKQEPEEFRLQVATAGWRLHESAFVSLDRVIKLGPSTVSVCPPSKSCDLFSSIRQGCAEVWKREVAAVAQCSTAATLSMSAAFAAPLLSLLARPPFILNLFGGSKTGKTTALLSGAAVIGLSEENVLPNWNSTDAGLLQLFRAFNDSIVPVNELGLLKGKKTDRGDRVREMIYAFGEGRDRLRHSASSYAAHDNGSIFKGILLSTSETSFHELRGSMRDDGELARAHDVPALLLGSKTIFDRLSETLSPKKTRTKLNIFRRAITQNPGVVFVDYIKWLASTQDIEEKARAHIETFIKQLSLPADDGVLFHAANNFGVCFAGAVLGIEAGVLPWNREAVLATIVGAFEEFRKVSGRPVDIRRKAKKILKSKIRELNLRRVTKIKEVPIDGAMIKEGSRRMIVIPSPRFDELFESEAMAREALMALDEAGLLRKTKSAGPATTANKKWAEVFVKLADGNGKFRGIVFCDLNSSGRTSKKPKA